MYTRIDIEGVDKTGKDTICQYVNILSNYKYIINTRGILSQIVYNELYNRNADYNKCMFDNDHTLIVYLTANLEDLETRFKLTGETRLPLQEHIDVFNKARNMLRDNGIKVIQYDTSEDTPFTIAKDIIDFMERNGGEPR